MKTNRFISLLLCVVMIMSLFTGLAGSAYADDIITHEVQSGEILLKICDRYGLDYYTCKNAIMALNGFSSEAQLAKLSVGQKIKLPASNDLAKTVTTSTAVVTSTSIGGVTTTTTTTAVGGTFAGGGVAFYLTPYTVQAGDTLNGICSKLGSNYYYYSPVILGINSLTNANYIRPGQVLLIPTTSPSGASYAVIAHQVKAGETTTSICSQYGVNYQASRQLVNGLNRRDNMDKIYAGQTVYVPSTSIGGAAATTTVVTSGTSTGIAAASAGAYTITIASGNAFASANGQDYVTSAPAGVEVSIWSSLKAGYAVKNVSAIRTDTGAPLPVDFNYFTMPNSNVYVEVEYEKGLEILKAKAQGGSFETLVGGFYSNAAFAGDTVTILAYPNQFYSVSKVSYQKADYTVTSVDVKKDASGNYSFTMPNYPVRISVSFAPTQYHTLSYSGVVGNGKVSFTVGDKEVTQVEQGELVTMKFVPDANWAFNTSDFENSLAAHMPNKSSVGSFKKVDDTTYTFIMGTKDINIAGIQFLNRSSYVISNSVWTDMNGYPNGYVYFNVIDQATGNITYNTPYAKFGDTVQVVYYPYNNYVPDAQYAKDNSKGAGNALLGWSSDSTFTMPDSNVTVNARFVLDGATHTYSSITKSVILPWNDGGTVVCEVDGAIRDTAEIGKVVTIRVSPKPNYDLSVAKYVGINPVYAVTVNGYLSGDAPTATDFQYLGYDAATNVYSFSFVKGAANDDIRVAFASDYQGVNTTFTQITEGGDLVVQGIKGFAVNGSYVQGDVQVVSGDTVSFTLDVKEGYEITGVRKYVTTNATDPLTNEVAGTTAIIAGGTNNSYSYTVTPKDIPTNPGDWVLVFEITARKIPETSYTVKYTTPMIDGQTPLYVGAYSFTAGDPFEYELSAEKVSDGSSLPLPSTPSGAFDISGIPGTVVEANDAMISVRIPKDNVYVVNKMLQTELYAFDKLLLNGVECANIDSSSDPDYFVANFIFPKDVTDYILTTEVVFKLYKTIDATPIILSTLDIGSDTVALKAGVFDYTFNTSETGVTILPTPDPSTAKVECMLNGKAFDLADPANWVTGPNTLVIKLSGEPGYTDTTYTITVNYGMEASKLTSLKVDGTEVTPSVTDPAHPADVTVYEASVTKPTTPVVLAVAGTFKEATWVLNGETLTPIKDTSTTKSINWKPGDNTLEISVTEKDKAPTTYVVHVLCTMEASADLTSITITGVNGDANFVEPGKYEYALKCTKNPSDIAVTGAGTITIQINGGPVLTTSSLPGNVWENTTGENTVIITHTETDKAPVVYTIALTMDLDPAAMDIYLKLNGEMIKFTSQVAYVNTIKETADFEIKLNAATDKVKVDIGDIELIPYTPGTTVHALVEAGKKVEKWTVGYNTVKFTVLGDDMKETEYIVYVNYQATPLTLKTLTRSAVDQSLATYQYWTATTAMTSDVIAGTADIGTIGIRVDGDTAVTGTRTIDWSAYTPGAHYIDIEVKATDYTTGTYHIDVNLTTP